MKARPFLCLLFRSRTFQWEDDWPIFCGKMGGNYRQQMGPLYRTTQIQDTIHQNFSFVICSDQNESILLPVSQRRDRKPSQQMGSGKGTESGNSRLLFLDLPCSKKERKVTFDNRPFFIEPIHKETGFQNGDSQVGETSDETQSGLGKTGKIAGLDRN